MPTLLEKPELNLALQRVAELEAEVRELRGASNGVADTPGLPPSGLTSMRLNEVEALLVRRAMAHHGGNISRAARQLGLSRSALYRRLDRHKI